MIVAHKSFIQTIYKYLFRPMHINSYRIQIQVSVKGMSAEIYTFADVGNQRCMTIFMHGIHIGLQEYPSY